MALRHSDCSGACCRAAGVPAVVLQLDRGLACSPGSLCFRAARDEHRLPPAPDSPKLFLPALVLERVLVIVGACCLQESPTVWVALHRQHHSTADKEDDPHSPVRSFLWAHVGWLVIKSGNAEPLPSIERYARDLLRDQFYG